MLKRLTVASFAIALSLVVPAAAQTKADMPLVDLTDDFARIWDETAQLPDAERPAAFKAAFAKIFPGFYDEKRFDVPTAKYDERLLKRLKEYPPKREGIQRVATNFAQVFAPARKSFEAEFGSMADYPPIYLVNSLGEFDGGTRELPEGVRLLFGADVIDQLYKTTPIQPFFHHELFHIVHHASFPDCEPIWCGLWGEGLAVYVASRLNPGASDASLLLTFPVPLRPAVEGHKQEAICAVRARLNSTDSKDYGPLFTGGGEGLSANLPPRFAYYVGYRVAEDIGRNRSLKELAALSQAQVKPLIEASLAKMADCSAATESKPVERG
jgi:hypothetical protein